ncbi:DUF916 and DUF3324 domain-containing protein [Enterococcus avium]|uniref:DUF916 and DUF3324 domain-containing protein n=1 Tax=Enterococcus avium TaxID=33945 RepID=UPI002703F5A7|nr:DUF916 and DUF3324 domain-containing protein [Enterococcus avium]MDO7798984.1 DUF916 and DUF3324 domain-containing protein [Enterococcus avium]
MKAFKRFSCLLLVSIAFLINGSVSQAKELAAGFTIEGIPNEKQIDKDVGYFYLKENPSETDDIKVKLVNDSDKPKTLQINVVDANTNVNGTVDYTGELKNHSSLTHPLTSIVEASKKEVTVPKHSEMETTLKVNMPTESFEGVIVGGVVVSEKNKETKKENMSIGNTYSYTLAIVLTNNENTPIKNNVSLELNSVGAILFDGKKIVEAKILNKNPYIFDNATITGAIYEKESGKKIISNKKEKVVIAPYSTYPLQFDWEKENLKPGVYRFVGKATSGDKQWLFEDEFEITGKQAKKLNTESVFKVYIPTWLDFGSLIAGGIATIGTIWLFIRKQRRG